MKEEKEVQNGLSQAQIDGLNKFIIGNFDGDTSRVIEIISDFIHSYARILFLAINETEDIAANIDGDADPWVITEIYKALTGKD
ncbi:hypothetical protein Barb6XT_02499 [Bacteroidales bacterium Barb6XT]|nr:hypothetical protein Barb6XT_02499 [Bacteroidales bacterium Barb6XT]